MARELTTLPKTAFSGLDYDNILQDVINLVKDNPDYNTNWDDFLSSDAGRMLIEIFAYISDQLATRIDWVVNENYLSTATQKRSIMRLLKIIGYNFTLPIAANVSVDITTTNFSAAYYLTSPYDSTEGTIFPFTLTAVNTAGTNTTFELLNYDSTTEKYDYKLGVSIASESSSLSFYEGKTYVQQTIADTNNGFNITLTNSPIIEKSIRVYFVNGSIETEMLEVTSFLDLEAQAEEDSEGNDYGIPFVLEVNEDETVTIETGTTAILTNSNRRLNDGDVIRIFYRTGGGTTGNITSQTINTTKTLSVELVSGGDTIVSLNPIINLSQGSGGTDGETADHAATYAPLQLRTVDKAVSAEDYDTLLNAKSDILTAKVYGNSNIPSTVFTEYGIYLNPFDVWIYALPNTSEWSSYNASRYNDIEWIELKLQNMFNNINSFRDGAFNSGDSYYSYNVQGKTLQGDTINWRADGDTYFKNYLVFDVPTLLKNNVSANGNMRIKITTSVDTGQSFENLSNVIVGELTGDAGDTYGGLMIKGDTRAYYQSTVDIEDGINLTTKKWIRIDIDEIGDTSIDLTTDGAANVIDITSVKPDEIAAAINYKLANLIGYGGLYGDSTTGKAGDTGVASVIRPDASTSYLKLRSPLSGDTSFIHFKNNTVLAGDSDATDIIFGDSVTGDTYACYGYRRITYIPNSGEANYQKILYENGSLNLDANPDDFYIHYIYSVGDTINLGDYFYNTYGAANPNDPLHRIKAQRIYNSVSYGDTSGDSVNPFNSNFEFKFTKTATDSLSLYNITESWNFIEAIKPKLTGDTDVIDSSGDTINGLNADHYAITFNIDGLGDTFVDVTGDSGITGNYLIDDVVNNINNSLQTSYGDTEPYDTFIYAKKGDTFYRKIIIESPSSTSNSFIAIKPLGDTNYAAEQLGFVVDMWAGDSYYWYATGDYYLWYNSTRDAMDLIKLNPTQMSTGDTPGTSGMPDGNFYTHFIWDRRGDTISETTYQTYLQNAKIIGVENVFKETKFSPFYVVGTVYYNENYSKAVVKDTMETAVREEYSFVNSSNVVKRDYNESLSKSQLLKTMLDVYGVEYVEITYFGLDSSDSTTNEDNTITCNFDEILILHEGGASFTYFVLDEN